MLSLQLDNKSLLRLPDRDRKRSREVQAWDGTSIEDPLADPTLSSSASHALGSSCSSSILGRFPSPLTKTGAPPTTHRDPHLSSGPLSRHARSPPPSTQPQPFPACSTPLDFRPPSHSPWQRHQPSCSKPLLHFASPSPS
ncbi:MAG: hypothetical protein Q8P67_21765, partial [archaeon]|nr:hypothetical protein [archaeon]